jgi:hypothetical protein
MALRLCISFGLSCFVPALQVVSGAALETGTRLGLSPPPPPSKQSFIYCTKTERGIK